MQIIDQKFLFMYPTLWFWKKTSDCKESKIIRQGHQSFMKQNVQVPENKLN